MFGSKLDILNQQWIDVVFSGRNKAYGAYELRRDNGRNTSKALLIGIVVFVFLISANTSYNVDRRVSYPRRKEKVKITNVVLAPPPPDAQRKPPPPPPPEPPKPKIDQVKFPPPVVKPDVEVKEKTTNRKGTGSCRPWSEDR